MKTLATSLILFMVFTTFGQDTLFYDANWKKVNHLRQSEYYTVTVKDKLDSTHAKETSYFKGGQPRQETFYSNYAKNIKSGSSKTWYKNGKLKEEAHYTNNQFNGKLQTFWDNGQLKRDDTYDMGRLVAGKLFNSDGAPTQYYDYEIMPQFPGGFNELVRYLSTNIHYPKKAKRQKVAGKVILKFVVDTDGAIQHITVEKSVSKELDAEAIRVVKKMPKWQPGLFDGIKVKVYYLLPVSFTLN